MAHYLITGVGRGIGEALARLALSRGHEVTGSVRNKSSQGAEALAAEGGNRFSLLQFDVTNPGAIQAAAAAVEKPVDVLVNNAGVIGPDRQSTLDMDFPGFTLTFDINVLGPLRVTQAFLPHLRKSENGRVVMISSQMGGMHYAESDRIAYRASKSALNKVMQGLSTDLKPDGISVVSVHPGWVQTSMGGPAADITPQASAAGIHNLTESLTLDASGKFFDWDGRERVF